MPHARVSPRDPCPSTPVASLPADPPRPRVPGRADRQTPAQGRKRVSITHNLGTEQAVARRVAAALGRHADGVDRFEVPLALLGDAVTNPAGPFDDDDPDDRALVGAILRGFATRIRGRGWEVGPVPDPPPAGVHVPVVWIGAAASAHLRPWSSVAPRSELARWAQRSAAIDADAGSVIDDKPVDEPDDVDEPADEELAWVLPDSVRAAPSPAAQPFLTHGPPSSTLSGCLRGRDGVPCVAVRPGANSIRCGRCGVVTYVLEPHVGPRLACECVGIEIVCVHPPAPRRAS